MTPTPFLLLTTLAALSCATTADAQNREQLLYRDARAGVVTVIVHNAGGAKAAVGTGFFVDSAHVVSCRHVFENGATATVKLSDSVELDVIGVVADDFSADLIEVAVERWSKKQVLRLAPKPVDSGAAVVVVGSPGGYEKTVLTGVVTGFSNLPGGVNLVQTSAPITSGSSGSPVLDGAGNVVGVASISNVGAHIGYAVSVEHVAALHTHPFVPLATWSAGAIHHVDWGSLPIRTGRPPSFSRSDHTRSFVAEYTFGWAVDYYNQHDLPTAMNYFYTVCELTPLRAEAWLYAGRCAAELGHAEPAVTMLDNASRLDPRNREALAELVAQYSGLHRFDDAQAVCTRLLTLDSTNPIAWYNLGVLRGESGHDSLALIALDRAARYNHADPLIHYSRGRVMLHLARTADAEREFRAALAMDTALPDARYQLATLLFETERTHEAQGEFERVVRADSTNANAWLSYGITFLDERRYADAIAPLKRSLRLRADVADAWGSLGECYHELGQRDEEYEAWKQVVRLNPKDPFGHLALGMACILYRHDRPAALEQYELLKPLDANMAQQLFDTIYQ